MRQSLGKALRPISIALSMAICALMAIFAIGCSDQTTQPSSNAANDESASDAGETITFTDSLGREVEIPANVQRVAPLGQASEQMMLSLAPDKICGLPSELTETQLECISADDADLTSLPTYGSAVETNDNTLDVDILKGTGADAILASGPLAFSQAGDLDRIQEQTGIPTIFIDCSIESAGQSMTTLGAVLSTRERAQTASTYLNQAFENVSAMMASIPDSERTSIVYVTGEDANMAPVQGSPKSQAMDMVAENLVVDENATSQEIPMDIATLIELDPQVILFQNADAYVAAEHSPEWAQVPAIQSGSFYLVPSQPWCWLDSPEGINQTLGVTWLAQVLYPDVFDTPSDDAAKSYMEAIFSKVISDSTAESLVNGAYSSSEA